MCYTFVATIYNSVKCIPVLKNVPYPILICYLKIMLKSWLNKKKTKKKHASTVSVKECFEWKWY